MAQNDKAMKPSVGGLVMEDDKAARNSYVLERLVRVWEERKKSGRPDGSKITQQDAADYMGVTQSAITQWLRGKIPLGAHAVLRFARYLQVPVTDIDPDWVMHDLHLESLNEGDLAAISNFMALSPENRDRVAAIIEVMRQAQSAEKKS